jgi:orotidine-5'-phosphate decarboxylase
VEVYVRLSGRTAEEAFLAAREIGGAAGFAIDVDLVAGIGPALVSALDELGPVMVLGGLSGPPPLVAAAAGRLARLGASWVTVSALAGATAVAAAVEAVAGTGCGIAAATLSVGLDATEVTSLTGTSRGRLVSRLAAAAAGAGATGIVGSLADLGVIAQVAPGTIGIVDAGPEAAEWAEASRRGAGVVVLPGPGSLRAFAAGGGATAAASQKPRRRR